MKVHGNRVYLNMPLLPESKLELSAELKKEMQFETAEKFQNLTVFAVGDAISHISVGDNVFVDPVALKRAPIIVIEGSEKIVVPVFDIMHTW